MGSRLEANSSQVRKRIEKHTFTDDTGDEYGGSEFGGFDSYFRRKKIKLQNLDAAIRASVAEDGKPQIFKGVVAHVMGYTQPSLQVLHRELVQHGAGFLQYLDSKTMATHIIASAMPPKKAAEFSNYKIVKPAWVVDSIAAGRLLLWSDYRVIDEGPRQRILKFGEDSMVSQAMAKPREGYREQTNNSYYTSQFKTPNTSSSSSTHFASPATFHKPPTPETVTKKPLEDIEDVVNTNDMLKNLITDDIFDDSFHDEPSIVDDTKQAAQRMEDEKTNQQLPLPPPPPKVLSSEEHNALMLADPHIRKSSSANPEFLKQFYSESRLHHLSTWKAELKSKMQRLAAEKGPRQEPVKRVSGSRHYIMHVDFDSFFCAVSLKKHPQYTNRPAVVAHSSGSGSEIASCNYPARDLGVKNGMWMKKALELCPTIKVLPYDFPAYEEASHLFYESILSVGGLVQSVSVDEALVDITAVVLDAVGSDGKSNNPNDIRDERLHADKIASTIRKQIREATKCEVSVGIGENILLAKVALRRAKPAGQYHMRPEEMLEVLGDLSVASLPGVARSISGKLEDIGIKLVRDIRANTKERLTTMLGPKTGEKLWDYARGIDRTELGDQPPRKSVSAEINWGIRFINQQEAEEFVLNLCKELERRLHNEQVKGKQLTMKIMRRQADAPLDPSKALGHGKCDTFNKSILFGVATQNGEVIGKEAVSILRSFKFSPGDLRGLGVQLTKLESIKVSARATAPDGSQKRLSFGSFGVQPLPAAVKRTRIDPIEEEMAASLARPKSSTERMMIDDPIEDDPVTPWPRSRSGLGPQSARGNRSAGDYSSNLTPINISGTQFLLPANPDPEVLAELPPDIRQRLMSQANASKRSKEQQAAAQTSNGSTSGVSGVVLPFQVDPEVFAALPDDMKAEILASYGHGSGGETAAAITAPAAGPLKRQSTPPREQQSSVMPLSIVRKMTVSPTKHASGTGRGRGRGRPRGTRMLGRERQRDAEAGRIQTSFLSHSRSSLTRRETSSDGGSMSTSSGNGPRRSASNEWSETPAELDTAFLAELPEDVRREVIAEHQRQHAARRSGTGTNARRGGFHGDSGRIGDTSTTTTTTTTTTANTNAVGMSTSADTTVPAPAPAPAPNNYENYFPAPPPQIAFPGSGMSTAEQVHEMLAAWHAETRSAGPHRRDVEVLEGYLARVVLEERNMDKAARLVRGLEQLVAASSSAGHSDDDIYDDDDSNGYSYADTAGKGARAWERAVQSIRLAVQAAVRQRGLGKLRI